MMMKWMKVMAGRHEQRCDTNKMNEGMNYGSGGMAHQFLLWCSVRVCVNVCVAPVIE